MGSISSLLQAVAKAIANAAAQAMSAAGKLIGSLFSGGLGGSSSGSSSSSGGAGISGIGNSGSNVGKGVSGVPASGIGKAASGSGSGIGNGISGVSASPAKSAPAATTGAATHPGQPQQGAASVNSGIAAGIDALQKAMPFQLNTISDYQGDLSHFEQIAVHGKQGAWDVKQIFGRIPGIIEGLVDQKGSLTAALHNFRADGMKGIDLTEAELLFLFIEAKQQAEWLLQSMVSNLFGPSSAQAKADADAAETARWNAYAKAWGAKLQAQEDDLNDPNVINREKKDIRQAGKADNVPSNASSTTHPPTGTPTATPTAPVKTTSPAATQKPYNPVPPSSNSDPIMVLKHMLNDPFGLLDYAHEQSPVVGLSGGYSVAVIPFSYSVTDTMLYNFRSPKQSGFFRTYAYGVGTSLAGASASVDAVGGILEWPKHIGDISNDSVQVQVDASSPSPVNFLPNAVVSTNGHDATAGFGFTFSVSVPNPLPLSVSGYKAFTIYLGPNPDNLSPGDQARILDAIHKYDLPDVVRDYVKQDLTNKFAGGGAGGHLKDDILGGSTPAQKFTSTPSPIPTNTITPTPTPTGPNTIPGATTNSTPWNPEDGALTSKNH